jgi:hypothetical protein
MVVPLWLLLVVGVYRVCAVKDEFAWQSQGALGALGVLVSSMGRMGMI